MAPTFEPEAVRLLMRVLMIIAASLVGLSGCSKTPPTADEVVVPGPQAGARSMGMTIQSTAFGQGDPIPKKYTGDGADVSPPLAWSNVPTGTRELALICDDPDAPTPQPWVHWVIYQISHDGAGLPEGIPTATRIDQPLAALQGRNSWSSGGTTGYRGPAPPPRHGTHHYHFRLYALDAPLGLNAGVDKATLLSAMQGHILAEAELTGTYSR